MPRKSAAVGKSGCTSCQCLGPGAIRGPFAVLKQSLCAVVITGIVAWSCFMSKSIWTPWIVANEHNREVYLVVDDFGSLGRAWRGSGVGDTGLETVVRDLLEGQYCNPVRVAGFNVAEGWCRDVSAEVAHELQKRCSDQMRELPSFLQEFVRRHAGKATPR